VRLFLAVTLPPQVRDALDALARRHAIDAAAWRFVPASNLHLTLRFLGSVSPELDARSRAGWAAVASESARFELRLGGAGSFPAGRRPRLLWVGVEELHGTARLAALADALERAARLAGFTPESRPFRGHVTLARARDGAHARAPGALDVPPLAFSVDRLVLVESRLAPAGARYTAVESWPLGARGAAGREGEASS
jgi:2'-5' RNA ligase